MIFDENQEISFIVRMRENLPEVDRIRSMLLNAFSEVLASLGDNQAARWVHELEPPSTEDEAPGKFAQVQSICFQIQNLVENAISMKVAEKVNNAPNSRGESGFWLNYLYRLRHEEMAPVTIAKRIESSFIEVVYTKHPTEAKRWVILHLHRRLSSLILQLSAGQDVSDELCEVLELLWRSGELYTAKPTVKQERRNLDYYFSEIFPEARKVLEQSFKTAWKQVFPAADMPRSPTLRVATWVGGDRDGHPLVTSGITADTLQSMRELAIRELIKGIRELEKEVRFHRQSQPTPEILCQWLETQGLDSQSDEPWSQTFERMALKLENSVRREVLPNYPDKQGFLEDITMLEQAFEAIQAHRLVRRYLDPIYSQLSFYGFHAANLDIRQNSQAYQHALVEILTLADIPNAEHYPDWPEAAKLSFIQKELANNRPFLLPETALSEGTAEVLQTFRVIKAHMDQFGHEGIGDFIVSMTKSTSDLLALYLFSKEVGLLQQMDGKPVNRILVVPLFETMGDLEASEAILETYLSIPIVRDTLTFLAERKPAPTPDLSGVMHAQTVMLGYSDSNKDCGIWASQWTVYNTQKRLSRLEGKLGVPLRYFHGRGGTVGRGSGPMHRFIEALPQSGLEHGFRITEQGEVIAHKYNSVENAANNFEQLVAGVACAQLLPTHEPIIERATHAMMLVRDASLRKYRSLVEGKDFLTFYRQATPIDVIELSKIGSRPSRRTGTATLEDLRAIPWVFSWNQSRFYLPGWFGIGSGLEALEQQSPEDFAYLRTIWSDWPFLKYLLFNAESTVASCSTDIMQAYADLVVDEGIRTQFVSVIQEELNRTDRLLTAVLNRPFAEGRPRLYYTLKARDERLNRLHHQQIELLKKWRDCNAEQEAHPELLINLQRTINAIASGLKTTG